MNSKTEFLENVFSPKYDYSKVFYYKTCRNEKFSIQNLTFWKFFFSNFHCAGKRLLQNLITFFLKISFQTLIFNEKVCYKVMPFKMSTQSENYVVFPGANWVRTFFFRFEFLIEIWFLNKNWAQKLSFWTIIFLQNMIIWKVFYYKICRNEKFSIHNLKLWKNVISKSHFVGKSLLQNMIRFSRKVIWNSDF